MNVLEIIPICEKNIIIFFNFTLLTSLKIKNKYFKFIIPIFNSLTLFISSLSLLYYSNYYINQDIIWSLDLGLGFIIYSYMIYIILNWKYTSCFEHTHIARWKNIISLIFYIFYLIYWFYFAIIMFLKNNEPFVHIQILNVFMSYSWYLFFSSISILYYFICIKLIQRHTSINLWLKYLKNNRPSIEYFYFTYNDHHKKIKIFSRYWNILIFLGILLLTSHIPIDIISVLNHNLHDILGLVIKTFSLGWYIYNICKLNDIDNEIVPYLLKHKIYDANQIVEIEKHILYRPLGLNFFGFKLNASFVLKIILIVANLIIPTMYALLSNKIIG